MTFRETRFDVIEQSGLLMLNLAWFERFDPDVSEAVVDLVVEAVLLFSVSGFACIDLGCFQAQLHTHFTALGLCLLLHSE